LALVRKTLAAIKATPSRLDRAKIDSTTEAYIRRHNVEDGEGPEDAWIPVSPQLIRARLGMTQAEFAAALHVPLSTLRNWEQGRVRPDPAARALLRIVAKDPQSALALLAD
jgi:putative transcriptional regulator